MNIREQARAAGGEALVAIIDRAAKIEKDVFARLSKVSEEVLNGVDDDFEKAALAALCEAYSTAYANVVAIATMKSFGGNRAEGILMAVKSVSNNMSVAFDTLDANKAGVLDVIKAAAAKAKASK